MKSLLLILALIALGYVTHQHYFKPQPQETKAPTKQEVKKPKDTPVPFEKKEIEQSSKKVMEQLQQFRKKKTATIEQPRKEATKIAKTKVVKPKPQLFQSTKTAVARIRECIANGRFFEAATLCKTVRIPKGMDTKRRYFASLVAKVDKGLEKYMQAKITGLENKKRKAEAYYTQQLNKITLQKSPRRAKGEDAKHRQRKIDEKYDRERNKIRLVLKRKYNLYTQKIDTEIKSIKNNVDQIKNSLRAIQ